MTFEGEYKALAAQVDAMLGELDRATRFHETWKPAAFDASLHQRLGTSYATQAFLTTRSALRREMILAVTRLWDKTPRTPRIAEVARKLGGEKLFVPLMAKRAAGLSIAGEHAAAAVREALAPKRDRVAALAEKYAAGGECFEALKRILALRNQRLAHFQVEISPEAATTDPADDEIELLYQDTCEAVQLLHSIVFGRAFLASDAAEVYRRYAGRFWAGVSGELTPGHPEYRLLSDPYLHPEDRLP